MEALFGYEFWDHVVLGVTGWPYDYKSIENRKNQNKTENWWTSIMNKQTLNEQTLNTQTIYEQTLNKQHTNR